MSIFLPEQSNGTIKLPIPIAPLSTAAFTVRGREISTVFPLVISFSELSFSMESSGLMRSLWSSACRTTTGEGAGFLSSRVDRRRLQAINVHESERLTWRLDVRRTAYGISGTGVLEENPAHQFIPSCRRGSI
jgi:hypothetical protein